MATATRVLQENHRTAFRLLIRELGDRAIDTALFHAKTEPFASQILQTTWEEMVRAVYVETVGLRHYRLTARGWLIGLEVAGLARSSDYEGRLGRLFAAMKAHVTPRKESAIVDLTMLSEESGEPMGWVFNVIESKAGSTSRRTGPKWYAGERGRLIEVPVDFNVEPIDILAALTVGHLENIEELEARLKKIEEDRARFHCPYCDAPVSSIEHQDYPYPDSILTYQSYECGFVTADGQEESPCPYGPNWPNREEFELVTEQNGDSWICYPKGQTDRARRIPVYQQTGKTREEAEARAKFMIAAKTKL
jgi:hypothetical protein